MIYNHNKSFKIRLTHWRGPCAPDLLRSSASATTRRSLPIQRFNMEVRTGREKERFETGFSNVRTQKLMLNHALEDEAAAACLSSSLQLLYQNRSFWHLLLSASTPMSSKMFKYQELLKLKNGHWKSNYPKKVCQRHRRRNVTRGMTQTFVSYVSTTYMPWLTAQHINQQHRMGAADRCHGTVCRLHKMTKKTIKTRYKNQSQ